VSTRHGESSEIAATAGHSWCLDLVRVAAGCPVTGRGVRVAVLDTGIDLQHPDFVDRARAGLTARSFVPGESVQDGHGHGTHCAGIIAGPMEPAGGLRYAVAPNVDLLVAKVLTDSGAGTTDQILDGIDWAADHGARLISLSLGTARSLGARFSAAYERAAETLLNQHPGVLIVASAGNSSGRPFLTSPVENPAACPSVLAVAAIDREKRIADFSCGQEDPFGAVDLSAPGAAVHSAWTGGGHRSAGGTSAAAPHAAGVAALHLEACPTLTAVELRKLLLDGALPLGAAKVFGHGLVQAPSTAAERREDRHSSLAVHVTLRRTAFLGAVARKRTVSRLVSESGLVLSNRQRLERHGILTGYVDPLRLDRLKELPEVEAVEPDDEMSLAGCSKTTPRAFGALGEVCPAWLSQDRTDRAHTCRAARSRRWSQPRPAPAALPPTPGSASGASSSTSRSSRTRHPTRPLR
jgi:subtilisin